MTEPVVDVVADDWEFLSHFVVTRKSRAGQLQEEWYEFIEPLTMHSRHPFGYLGCLGRERTPAGLFSAAKRNDFARPVLAQPSRKAIPQISLVSVDYVLLQRLNPVYRLGAKDPHINGSLAGAPALSKPVAPNKLMMFDAGTSRFDSSLWWFICAYSQVATVFDQLFGWEYTLMEPQDFWDHVPPAWLGKYHFYNAPVSRDPKALHSPLRLIKQHARPESFVSFKLDIDTPAVEIPIALELLRDPALHALVDEFFFELHFHDEIMGECAWHHDMPHEVDGLKLHRQGAMELFRDYRRAGIRAHFWP